ncbi:MAG: VWA domain-containing protein [Chloroflexi bacterium]|nr:VWA domain-containing protein [Chloroflexota bacterium]
MALARNDALENVAIQLRQFPATVVEAFDRGSQLLEPMLTPDQLQAWANQGLALAKQSVRSWEAASEFFQVSPTVVPVITPANLAVWGQWGGLLCQDSPTVAVAYFRASPGSVVHLRSRQLTAWAGMGQQLYKGTWKSSALSCRFFETSPTLLRSLNFSEMERFVSFIDTLAHRSYDLAMECLTLSQDLFPKLGDSREGFITLLSAMAEGSWREVKGCFEVSAKALPRIDSSQRGRFLSLAERLARSGQGTASSFLLEASQALGQVDGRAQGTVLSLAETLLLLEPRGVLDFLRNAPKVLERINLAQLELWFAEGSRILRQNKDGGLAYLQLQSARAQEVLDNLSSAVELGKIKDLMRMYCRALAGAGLEIAATQELVHKGIGWVSKEQPTTEGSTVYLPPMVDRYSTKGSNFGWYKVVATHQVAHLEFGSFAFSFERPSTLFRDLRPHLPASAAPAQAQPANDSQGGLERRWLTDMQRFFDLFADRKLALDIFTVLEDSRVDAWVLREYAGIRSHYRRVQQDALEERLPVEAMPLREAMVEFLVRLSLQQYRGLPAPSHFRQEARRIARIVRLLAKPGARVEDTSEAALRVYSILADVPNQELAQEEWDRLDVDEEQEYEEPEGAEQLVQELKGKLSQHTQETQTQREQQGKPYRSPDEVEYRGEFKPELVQLLAKLKQTGQRKDGQTGQQPISKELLEQLLQQSAELEMEAMQADITHTAGMYANNLMREAGLSQPPPIPAFGQGPLVHTDDEGGPLEATEPHTYTYAEWDFRAADYRPRWCIIREKVVAEGDPNFWYQTLQSYAPMVAQIRRQFELILPETFRKIKRLEDGEEYDLDAVLEAMIDKRTGITPSEKLYWRRNKIERDVAVAFLLDMSASTAEAIDEAKRGPDEWDAPDDPVEYMLWLRSRRAEGGRRSYKRIIDLEKESTVLLIQAQETLGDRYGIYGFSGYGRENVEFYVIKDLDETLSDRVRRRVEKIAPLHATRMGPAIRHVTAKLDDMDAKTKVLFLISDGRPQDRGYSREGVEKEYAVHDTKMALTEARMKNITPFALTVDKAGHDYLKTMCSDMGYEVLADIHALPERLPYLYRRLTI